VLGSFSSSIVLSGATFFPDFDESGFKIYFKLNDISKSYPLFCGWSLRILRVTINFIQFSFFYKNFANELLGLSFTCCVLTNHWWFC
jgi:hypothetical protein